MDHPTVEADVVVVGAGPAGMSAALASSRAGSSTVLLEAREGIGGNALYSTGYVAMVDIPPQRDLGIEDSIEQWLDDGRAEVELEREDFGLYFDEQLWIEFGMRTREAYALLCDLGFGFDRVIPRPLQHRTPRMWALTSTEPFESGFRRALREAGVAVHCGTRARRLLMDSGRVIGVDAECNGIPRTFHAKFGVVLAAGGYQANHDYRERYQPRHLAVAPYHGVDTCRGDAHVMASALGADLVNMTAIPPLMMISSGLAEVCIAVNAYGRRFHDECGPYLDRVKAFLSQPERLGYYLCDGPAGRARERLLAHMEGRRSASSLDEVARLIGCESDELRASVVRWNAFLESGADHDPETGRVVFPEGRRGVIEPPFHVMPMIVGVNFTCGGARTNRGMGVLNVYGEPIAGLFAAGDCVGSVNAGAGLGGIHIMGALSLGMVAGRSAAEGRA